MAVPMTRLADRAFNHRPGDEVEAEYDRLRDLAREEAAKRNSCFDRAHQAYERGDGAAAKALSDEGKRHAARMEEYNRQASQFIFRENNAPGRVADDAIDVHGQFAEEAEDILEQRIRADQARGQSHLHVIVGKGNHSDGGVQKLKPRVEKVCRELGLQYATEENAGRIFVNLRPGGPAVPPPEHSGGIPPSHYKPQHVPGQEHGGGQQQHGGQQQQDELEKLAGALLPKLCKKLGDCCIVM